MHILLNTDGVSSQSSLPSVGQYASHVIREILNTGGVSFQLSFDRFVRFVFFKITVSVCIGLWASLGLFYNTNLTNQPNADMRNAFGVWNLTNNDRRRTMVSFCENPCDLWEKYSRAEWPPNISHSTFNTPHSTFHFQHSQHPSPESTRFFPSRPTSRPNTPFSRIFVTT